MVLSLFVSNLIYQRLFTNIWFHFPNCYSSPLLSGPILRMYIFRMRPSAEKFGHSYSKGRDETVHFHRCLSCKVNKNRRESEYPFTVRSLYYRFIYLFFFSSALSQWDLSPHKGYTIVRFMIIESWLYVFRKGKLVLVLGVTFMVRKHSLITWSASSGR